MTDLSAQLHALKPGDVVHCANGGKMEVEEYTCGGNYDSFHLITFKGFGGCRLSFRPDGRYYLVNPYPLDIISVTPCVRPFDWSEVKPGMAFKTTNGMVACYIGPALSKGYAVCHLDKYGYTYYGHNELTPAPEHDKEIG